VHFPQFKQFIKIFLFDLIRNIEANISCEDREQFSIDVVDFNLACSSHFLVVVDINVPSISLSLSMWHRQQMGLSMFHQRVI